MRYILGVDAGGTKTEAIAYDLDKNVLSKGYSGFGNILIDSEKSLENIRESINNCIANLKIDDCIHIYLGVAGVSAGNNNEKVENYIKENFNCKVTVVNDADLALSAMLKGKDGFLTIAGTGSVCIGKYKGKKVRVGGWGHLLGDEGSGYYIAIEALRKIILEKDSGFERSSFTQEILNKLGISDELDIINFVYGSDKGKIASIVPTIVKISKRNDAKAIKILRAAGRELGVMTSRAVDRMKIDETVNIAITGSILKNIDLVKENFISALKDTVDDFNVYDQDISATIGAYYEVIKEINK